MISTRHPKAVLLDRDGVLNRKPSPQARYVRHWRQFKWLPKAKQALRLLKKAGYRLILITNQAGVGRGVMSQDDLDAIHERMQNDLKPLNAMIDAIYACTHGYDDGCVCRKPKPGLILQAQRDFNLNLARTPFLGDNDRDMLAGQAAGCPTYRIGPGCALYAWTKKFLGRRRA